MTPILFLDVDGTLIPYDGSMLAGPQADTKLSRINLALGPRLLALPVELMWATGWRHEANDVISPLLGFPRLPVVALKEPQVEGEEGYPLNWKTETLVEVAAGRPFVWIDDEITGTDRGWEADQYPGPALLFRVDAHFGLAEADLGAIERWLRDL
jgi:hypothetical protein